MVRRVDERAVVGLDHPRRGANPGEFECSDPGCERLRGARRERRSYSLAGFRGPAESITGPHRRRRKFATSNGRVSPLPMAL